MEYLSNGLEGRSHNPLSVLFDTLNHPDADFGKPSPSALIWKKDDLKGIPHLVLGSTEIGGSWAGLQGSKVLTLSHQEWLELPIYGYKQWEDGRPDGNLDELERGKSIRSFKRTKTSRIGDYYKDYVKELQLEDNFLSNATVTSVKLVQPQVTPDMPSLADCCGEWCDTPIAGSLFDLEEEYFMALEKTKTDDCCDSGVCSPDILSRNASSGVLSSSPDESSLKWQVDGEFKREDGTVMEFSVKSRYLVLASGVTGNPNRLGVPGEELEFVKHTFDDVDKFLAGLSDPSLPVLVVGAGLSAADMITFALSRGLNVLHAFYQDPRDPGLVFSKMTPTLYPEYHRIYSLMKEEIVSSNYRPFSRCTVQEFTEEGLCLLKNQLSGETSSVRISGAVVMIGSVANLSFLSEGIPHLGYEPDKPVSSKENPIEVDPFTFESSKMEGLFAMGPLVGDNFVRFVLGGAVGIVKEIHRQQEKFGLND